MVFNLNKMYTLMLYFINVTISMWVNSCPQLALQVTSKAVGPEHLNLVKKNTTLVPIFKKKV